MKLTRSGSIYKFGDVVLAEVQFVERAESKIRPGLVLFEEYGNIVIAGITTNTNMKGVLLKRTEGALFNSIIKLNYIFTITKPMIKKSLFCLTEEKKNTIIDEFVKRFRKAS